MNISVDSLSVVCQHSYETSEYLILSKTPSLKFKNPSLISCDSIKIEQLVNWDEISVAVKLNKSILPKTNLNKIISYREFDIKYFKSRTHTEGKFLK